MKRPALFSLFSILLAALLLFALSFGLQEISAANAQREQLHIMQALLPGSENFTAEPYSGEDAIIRSVYKGETGFVIETATQGYVDEIRLLIGVSSKGTVTGLVVREMHETISLGSNALTDWQFLAQFLNSKGDAEVGTNVDALTGATVTSKAIARCVNSAVGYVTGADAQSSATSWGG